jgi:hypothetical protein
MELVYFIAGFVFAMCVLPILNELINYIGYLFARMTAYIEIEVSELKCKFQEKYGHLSEESQNPIGFHIGQELDSQEGYYEDEDDLENKK